MSDSASSEAAPPPSSKGVARLLSPIVANFTVVAAVIGGLFALVQFTLERGDRQRQHELQAAAADRESKSFFLEKQVELYFRAVPLATRLATTEPSERTPEDLRAFWELYWGELGMVEDSGVERAMVLMGKTLGSTDPGCASKARVAALNLAHCVRESLQHSWGFDLDPPAPDARSWWRFEEPVRPTRRRCNADSYATATAACER